MARLEEIVLGVLPQLLASLVLVAVVLAIRSVVGRRLRENDGMAAEVRRRMLVSVRNACFLGFVAGMVLIWASQLQTLALSMVAVAAAVVIASKELIMCVSGGILKTTNKLYQVGDRIQIGELRGDVIDHSLLTTKIVETGPGQLTHQHTGRLIVIPNAMLLATPVVNESFTDDFVLHVFVVPLKRSEDWQTARKVLIEAARKECEPFLEEAKQHMESVGQSQALHPLSAEPRVTLRLPDAERIDLILRVPVRNRQKGRVEQAILNRFIDAWPGAEKSDAQDETPK